MTVEGLSCCLEIQVFCRLDPNFDAEFPIVWRLPPSWVIKSLYIHARHKLVNKYTDLCNSVQKPSTPVIFAHPQHPTIPLTFPESSH